MGPNPPPNAVQQVLWLQPDRKLLFGGRPVGATQTNFSMAGTWRLDGEHLVLEAVKLESVGTSLARFVGNAPPRSRMDDRIRLLERDGDTLRTEGAGDSIATFLRMPD
jgi:hypothetical protein